ncbi:hypothetical protein DLD82_07325 [Methanospirillum stamsii]|uniref:Uncharacterized protein n=1 Tax=Methanospirillum stamsii TaxID=1277351 RepID=A0A2V2N4K0_9EURY|nr:hypothetical protein DLD82_07325 [Methanospirillum stamsii]
MRYPFSGLQVTIKLLKQSLFYKPIKYFPKMKKVLVLLNRLWENHDCPDFQKNDYAMSHGYNIRQLTIIRKEFFRSLIPLEIM